METSKTPLVSVVIPFFNGATWLEEAIESVLRQTYTNYEILVVNDGSKEDITDLMEKYSENIRYFYQENAGSGKARNVGISHSNGEYIAFLDSDDVWCDDKLEKQIDYMLSHPEIMWSHSNYYTFGNESRQVDLTHEQGCLFPRCLASLKIATPCVMIKKTVFDDLKFRFCENMRYGQDFYLWVLLCEKYNIGFIQEYLSGVRIRGSNAARRAYAMLRAKGELWKNFKTKTVIDLTTIPFSLRFAYACCARGYSFVSFLEKKICNNKKLIEFVSKVLYLLPYLICKAKRGNE